MAELSPSSYAFPNCQSSHNPTSSAYGFNPASHMRKKEGEKETRLSNTSSSSILHSMALTLDGVVHY